MSQVHSVARARRKKPDAFIISFAIAGSLLLLFVVLPLLSTLLGTSGTALWETLIDADVQASILFDLLLGGMRNTLAMFSGVPLAYLLARYDFIGKRWVEGIINLPIVVPHTAAGIALLMIFGRQAPIGQALGIFGLRFTDGTLGIIVGMLFVSLPFLVNTAREAFATIDPELEHVAETNGRFAVASVYLRDVATRMARNYGGRVECTMWGRGISEFGAVVILAYNPKIIPVLVYERFAGFGLYAALPLTVILILASLIVFVALQILLTPQKEVVPIEE